MSKDQPCYLKIIAVPEIGAVLFEVRRYASHCEGLSVESALAMQKRLNERFIACAKANPEKFIHTMAKAEFNRFGRRPRIEIGLDGIKISLPAYFDAFPAAAEVLIPMGIKDSIALLQVKGVSFRSEGRIVGPTADILHDVSIAQDAANAAIEVFGGVQLVCNPAAKNDGCIGLRIGEGFTTIANLYKNIPAREYEEAIEIAKAFGFFEEYQRLLSENVISPEEIAKNWIKSNPEYVDGFMQHSLPGIIELSTMISALADINDASVTLSTYVNTVRESYGERLSSDEMILYPSGGHDVTYRKTMIAVNGKEIGHIWEISTQDKTELRKFLCSKARARLNNAGSTLRELARSHVALIDARVQEIFQACKALEAQIALD